MNRSPADTTERPTGLHPAWVMLAICFVNLFVNYSVRLGFGVALPEMIRDLGLSRTAGGTIYNSYLLTYIVVTPFTGYLTDRLGARRVISACLLMLAAGVLLLGSAEHLWTACVAFGLTGLGARPNRRRNSLMAFRPSAALAFVIGAVAALAPSLSQGGADTRQATSVPAARGDGELTERFIVRLRMSATDAEGAMRFTLEGEVSAGTLSVFRSLASAFGGP